MSATQRGFHVQHAVVAGLTRRRSGDYGASVAQIEGRIANAYREIDLTLGFYLFPGFCVTHL